MLSKKISILHIGSDEKFMNGANYIFEKAFPGSNHFAIPLSRFRRNFLYVKNAVNVEAVAYDRSLIKRLREKLENYDCIILHGITEINSTLFLSSKHKEKFVGIIWGAELYRDDNFPDRNFLGHLTTNIHIPEPAISFKEKSISFLKGLIYKKTIGSRSDIRVAVSKLSYFGAMNDLFFEDLKKRKYVKQEMQLIPFTYYPLEFIMKGNESIRVSENEIMVGNSASFTNNHLEAFEALKDLGVGNRRVIVPLSYGNQGYGDYIEEKGQEIFSDKFYALRDFMPLEEYNRVLQVCGIVIMNHYRSQAVGNIIAMLWLGSKLYLSQSNIFYQFLKRNGIRVFSIENDLKKENKTALENLSGQEIDQNREILRRVFSEESIVTRLSAQLLNIFHES